MIGKGFDEGYKQGVSNRLEQARNDIAAQNADTYSDRVEQDRASAELSKDFKVKQEFRGRLKEVAASVAALKQNATTPERMGALQQQVSLARNAFLEEARRYGMENEVDIMLKNAMMVPTNLEQAEAKGQSEAATINATADNLSPERQRGAGLVPEQDVSTKPLSPQDIAGLLQDSDGTGNADLTDAVVQEMIDAGLGTQAVEDVKQNLEIMRNNVDRGTAFSNLEKGTGVDSLAQGAINALPLINSLFGSKDIAQARNFIEIFNEDAKRAIIKNPRFPVAEQQKIQKLLPSQGISSQSDLEFEKLMNLKDFMEDSLLQQNKILNDNDSDQQVLRDAKKRKDALEEILGKLGDPAEYAISNIPKDAVAYLQDNPDLADQFDQKYGKGLAKKVLGK